MRVLTWNLFHGRTQPPARRALQARFAARLAAWRWDVALLQEVPPWWPTPLAAAASARSHCHALTSRNWLLPARRALAVRRPELIKSNGGGANAILVRDTTIVAHSAHVLRRLPERRVAQLARRADGIWLANLHASTRRPLAREEVEELWALALERAAGEPLILGGDLNLFDPPAPPGAVHAARSAVDHVFALGLRAAAEAERPSRALTLAGRERVLSDHDAVIAELEPRSVS
jgi:endonuclease/exonuclease/phosphatase family metal-dependent hydrolase